MKITSLTVNNFLGTRAVEVQLTKPVTIFAGKNGAGKSGLAEAIRMALVGESVRVSLKKDYAQLVSEGQEQGFAEVEIDGSKRVFVTIPDGKSTPAAEYVAPAALPYVLDAQRFAKLPSDDRRKFMFGLMGLSAGGAGVKKRLTDKGCDAKHIEAIIPMLRAGFDAACKEAQGKARDFKTEWRAITGETYGEKKAETWAAEAGAFNSEMLAKLEKQALDLVSSIAEANQCLGSLTADNKRHVDSAERLAELKTKSSKHEQILAKLSLDENQVMQWEKKVEETKTQAANARRVGLVHDLARALKLVETSYDVGRSAALGQYESEFGNLDLEEVSPNTEASSKLPEYEKALQLMKNAVANDKRDLADSDAATKAITELNAMGPAPDQAEIDAAKSHLQELTVLRETCAKEIVGLKSAESAGAVAIKKTSSARTTHESVAAWIEIADMLAPEGIPGEMLAEAIGPLNSRLAVSSGIAEWAYVTIDKDMQVLATGRPYALLSESEQWRVDAMIAEAISNLSGLGVLVLDRVDVLDLQGREDLIAWLDVLATDNQIQSALIFGTFKSQPSGLPETVASFWIESGVVASKLQEAA